jgi:hypothetical protein
MTVTSYFGIHEYPLRSNADPSAHLESVSHKKMQTMHSEPMKRIRQGGMHLLLWSAGVIAGLHGGFFYCLLKIGARPTPSRNGCGIELTFCEKRRPSTGCEIDHGKRFVDTVGQ